jgi:hypothetical protein
MALEGDTLTYTYDGERNVLLDSVRGGDSRLRRRAALRVMLATSYGFSPRRLTKGSFPNDPTASASPGTVRYR